MFIFILTIGCNNFNENGDLTGMKFGKNITIIVSDDEIIDGDYLQRMLDGEIKKEIPYFDLWDNDELKNMIDYMKKNNFIIASGQYTFNQSWKFEDGTFIIRKIKNGKIITEKCEIFKFQPKGY